MAQRGRRPTSSTRSVTPTGLTDDERRVQRQAFAGLLWTKQFYHYDVAHWLEGDPASRRRRHPRGRRPQQRLARTSTTATSSRCPTSGSTRGTPPGTSPSTCIPLAHDRPGLRQAPAAAAPARVVHAPQRAAPGLRVGLRRRQPAGPRLGRLARLQDRPAPAGQRRPRCSSSASSTSCCSTSPGGSTARTATGNNVFQGGFLGLDNIGVFDRSAPLPTGGHLEQADGTAWMALLLRSTMLPIALELARDNPAYEDIATKFFEHFVAIADAINGIGESTGLWDEEDGFYYDVLHLPDGHDDPLKVRSLVGLIPLFAVETFERRDCWPSCPASPGALRLVPRAPARPGAPASRWHGAGRRRAAGCWPSFVDQERLQRVLRRMLDERRVPLAATASARCPDAIPTRPLRASTSTARSHAVRYEPAESRQRHVRRQLQLARPDLVPAQLPAHRGAADAITTSTATSSSVECPTGSGQRRSRSGQVADELSRRLVRPLPARRRRADAPVLGADARCQTDPHWRDLLLFYEYFHGDTGAGLGASHQTGWTALVAKLLDHQAHSDRRPRSSASSQAQVPRNSR